MSELDESQGFIPYRRGSGRLADKKLETLEGSDEWTPKDIRAAKLLKRKNKLLHGFRRLSKWLRDAVEYVFTRPKLPPPAPREPD